MSSQTFSEMCEESAVRLYLKQSGLDDAAIDDYLEHHGIKGMKWGQRRWQNDDGSLTAAGREHYSVGQGSKGSQKEAKKLAKLAQKTDQASIPFTKSGRYIGNTRKADHLRKKLLSTPQVRDAINRARDTQAKVAAADTRVDQLTDQFYGNKDGMFKKYQEMALKERLDDFRKDLERDGVDKREDMTDAI